VTLPTYPWQRRSFWTEAAAAPSAGPLAARALLGARISAATIDAGYEGLLSFEQQPWLADHRVGGRAVVPAAALGELAWQAAREHRQRASVLADIQLPAPLIVSEHAAPKIQVLFSDAETLGVYSQREDAAPAGWHQHASARVLPDAVVAPAAVDLDALRRRCAEAVDVPALYESLRALGVDYGAAFRGIRSLSRGRDEALGEVALPDGMSAAGFGAHPALLDAAFQVVAGAVGSSIETEHPFLPVAIGRMAVHAAGASRGFVHVRLRAPTTRDGAVADVTLSDATGAPLVEISELVLRPVDLATLGRGSAGATEPAFFRIGWEAVDALPARSTLGGRWLVVATDSEPSARSLGAALARRGASADVAKATELQDTTSADHVVCVWEPAGGAREAVRLAEQALALVQGLISHSSRARVWWVTRRSISVAGEEVAPAAASLWGLGRSLMLEHPELHCTLLDVEPEASVSELIARELAQAGAEQQVSWRQGRRHVARLLPARLLPARSALGAVRRAAPESRNGSVLITGGLGALGRSAARVLARLGVQHIVLCGRRGASVPGSNEARAELEALGASVTLTSVDVTDRAALTRVIATLPREYPLLGVVHAAGVLDDGVLSSQTPERLTRVMAAKVFGAWHLHELTAPLSLDFFITFSSLAGSLGSPGQGAYAAANTFLDGLVASRRARGLAGQSLAWGPWSEQGLAASLSREQQQRLTAQGVRMISPDEGEALFSQALTHPEPNLIVAPLDLELATRTLGAINPALWSRLLPSPSRASPKGVPLAEPLGELPPAERAAAVARIVQTEVARVLSLPGPAAVPLERALKDLGLDSLMMLELRRSLMKRTGVTLPTALALEKPTPGAIARQLLSELEARVVPDPSAPHTNGSPRQSTSLEDRPAAIGRALAIAKSPRVRLICFHHAGGEPESFSAFSHLADAGIELHTLTPSRASPITQASARAYLDAAARYAQSLSGVPLALLGHSLGSLFAWRVAHELALSSAEQPLLLVVSAPPVDPTMRTQPMDGAMPHSGPLEADTFLWSFMPPAPTTPLRVPIAAFLGKDDPIVKQSMLRPWETCTTRGFRLTVLPGHHFYLYQAGSAFLQELTASVEGVLSDARGAASTAANR
jgi:surfactin synthase thioesterase subunit/NAD(P)-dependent dehydrogenase (short-subunit alcohol dehydrogenase family)/acyl carrier protein